VADKEEGGVEKVIPVRLERLILDYQDGLRRLVKSCSATPASHLRAEALGLLTTRDEIAEVVLRISSGMGHNSVSRVCGLADALLQVREQDAELRKLGPKIKRACGASTLAAWREEARRPPWAWWWHPDKPPPAWAWLTLLSTVVSLAVLLRIVLKFLSAGADFLSVSQVLTSLLVGGTILQIPRESMAVALTRIGISESHHYWKAGLSLFMLLLILALNSFGVPLVARCDKNEGSELFSRGQLSKATDKFRHAIALNDEDTDAHFRLGNTYEELGEFDKSIGEYVAALDDKDYRTYNNLARLYILRHEDYSRALIYLNTALKLAGSSGEDVRYSIYKNLGWAYFGLGLYDDAQADLNRAVELDGDRPAAHYLLAEVYDARAEKQQARAERIVFLSTIRSSPEEVEKGWIERAEHLVGKD
jgi:tetratricopeptide (TPR) repeat protein